MICEKKSELKKKAIITVKWLFLQHSEANFCTEMHVKPVPKLQLWMFCIFYARYAREHTVFLTERTLHVAPHIQLKFILSNKIQPVTFVHQGKTKLCEKSGLLILNSW